MTKTLKLITVQGYLVAVSDAPCIEGRLFVYEYTHGGYELAYYNSRIGKGLNIEGYLPLEENLPPLKGIDFLPTLSEPHIPIAFECGVEELFAEDGKTKIGEDLAVEIIEGFTAYLSGKYIYE
jgi:hypothetical protein